VRSCRAVRSRLGSAGLSLLLLSGGVLEAQARADSTIVGRWVGSGQIAVDWTRARTLDLDLRIHSDGQVTGMIGDATLIDGRIRRNGGWFPRLMHIGTEWTVSGLLLGAIVAEEGIQRDRVTVGLNQRGGGLVGGLTTSGRLAGGASSMSFAVGKLRLTRQAPQDTEPPETESLGASGVSDGLRISLQPPTTRADSSTWCRWDPRRTRSRTRGR